MSKNCKHPTCEGICRRVKAPKKAKSAIKSTYRIKKVTKKQAKKNRSKDKIRKIDHVIYMEIWEEREHLDFETGLPILSEVSSLLFHHVLPKRPKSQGGYPEFRHEKWNIILVSWETHTKAENNIDLVPKIKAYRDYLLKKYVYEPNDSN